MKLTKFRQRRDEILRKQQEELEALAKQEEKELQKMVEPVIEKVTKVANEEARKILEKQPEILEGYSFKKRDAAKVINAALESLFQDNDDDEDLASTNTTSKVEEKSTPAKDFSLGGAKSDSEEGNVQSDIFDQD